VNRGEGEDVNGGREASETEGPRARVCTRAGSPKMEVLPDGGAVGERAAAHVSAWAREAVAAHGRFTFAVSGGHTPWAMFGALADEKMPWRQTAIFQVDERVAPRGDPDRNLTHLLESLPERADTDIHGMPVEDEDLEAAAEGYERSLPERFDLVHLGLGPDGHTASLVPGDPVLEVADRNVALTGIYMGRRRMTLTYPPLDRARRVLWLVTGADKVDALARLLTGDQSIPAGRVSAANALIVADVTAAGTGTGTGTG
jgi:6-phosphogluconolactonase